MIARDDLARVRRIALSLPDVEEGTTFGYPAFKVAGHAFAWFPKKKEVEPGSLGVRVSFLDRDYLISWNSDIYYYTAHYNDYTSVLARVWLLKDDALRELLESGHEFITAEVKRKKRRKR